ncbi:membrane protein [Deinobacterium chartae]|uniref:Membrane protein n=1 Tax=Deinobacterium chartae TaxID=521158 RepID=A0A841I796_9DEIO|nr:membrane protein [Deinobacterium chartae]
MTVRTVFELLRDAARAFGQDNAARLSAALAYSTVFALSPLLLLAVTIAGYFLGQGRVEQLVLDQVTTVLGRDTADFIESLLMSAQEPTAFSLAAIIGVALLFFAASNIILQLQASLNTLWGATPPPGGLLTLIRDRLVAFTLVIGFALFVGAFLIGNTVLAVFAGALSDRFGGGAFWLRLGTFGLQIAMFTGLFAMIYKVLPSVKLNWRDVWLGAFVTSLLFSIGQHLIGFYFGRASPASPYGAAGSLVVLLLWIYYSSQILFFGAELIWVYVQRRDHPGHSALHKTMPLPTRRFAVKGDLEEARRVEIAQRKGEPVLRTQGGPPQETSAQPSRLAAGLTGLLGGVLLALLALPVTLLALLLRALLRAVTRTVTRLTRRT